MIVVKHGVAQVAMIVRGEELRTQLQSDFVRLSLDDGLACALERVAPATYAGVELEIGQGDPHCYLQSSKSIYLQWVQLGEEDPPTGEWGGWMEEDATEGEERVAGMAGSLKVLVLLHFFVSIYGT